MTSGRVRKVDAAIVGLAVVLFALWLLASARSMKRMADATQRMADAQAQMAFIFDKVLIYGFEPVGPEWRMPAHWRLGPGEEIHEPEVIPPKPSGPPSGKVRFHEDKQANAARPQR